MNDIYIQCHIHSLNGEMRSCRVIARDNAGNPSIVEYESKKCTVIYNPWNGYYADDIYGIVKENE